MTNSEFLSSFNSNANNFARFTKRAVSSSRLQKSVSFKNEYKSFKFILKRNVPNIDPCGTPHDNSFHQSKVLLILTLCHLLF